LLAGLYGVLGAGYAHALRAGQRRAALPVSGLTALAVIAHGALLARTLPLGHGMDVGFGNALSATAALVMLAFVITRAFQAIDALGMLLAPAAGAAVLVALVPEPAQ